MFPPPAGKHRLPCFAFLILAFTAGGMLGGMVTKAAAARATRVYMAGARLRLMGFEERQLASSWAAGDMDSALAHATCALDVGFGAGGSLFEVSPDRWSPWGAALTDLLVVEPNANKLQNARPGEEALVRAKVALVLDRLGRASDAQEQLALAARSSGALDTAGWRDLARRTMSELVQHPSPTPDGTSR